MTAAQIEATCCAMFRQGASWPKLSDAERAAIDRATRALGEVVTGKREGRVIWEQIAGDMRIVLDDFLRRPGAAP